MAKIKRDSFLLSILATAICLPSYGQGVYSGITAAMPSGSSSISPVGLVAAFDFETYTPAGLLKDFSSLGNDGLVNRTRESAGQFGQARVFTTLEDLVDLPDNDSLDLDGPLTIAAWIQFATPNLHQHIFNCDEMFVLWTTEANQYRLADTQGNAFTSRPGTVKIGEWHSVVAVLSASEGESLGQENIQIMIDGIPLEGSYGNAWSPSYLWERDACFIGASRQGTPAHQALQFEGSIDELHVYSRALSDDEMQAYSRRVQ